MEFREKEEEILTIIDKIISRLSEILFTRSTSILRVCFLIERQITAAGHLF